MAGTESKSLRKILERATTSQGLRRSRQLAAGGVRPLDGVAELQGRVIVMRLAGARSADWRDLFLALYHQKTRPAIYTFEPSASGDAVADLSAKLEAYETALTPVMSEYVAELGRTTAIRTLDAQPRLTTAQKDEARQKMDAAIPAQPQAKPRKARKLLVIDLRWATPATFSFLPTTCWSTTARRPGLGGDF